MCGSNNNNICTVEMYVCTRKSASSLPSQVGESDSSEGTLVSSHQTSLGDILFFIKNDILSMANNDPFGIEKTMRDFHSMLKLARSARLQWKAVCRCCDILS